MEDSIVAIILKAANERVAFNSKDYFDLAKEEVDKTVGLRNWGWLVRRLCVIGMRREFLLRLAPIPHIVYQP
uniref:Uncharacterized protein n=1 Tax=Kalanchoe fedtschenkoi TaxID=63787 RepID=A0A7N0TYG7_KALFE